MRYLLIMSLLFWIAGCDSLSQPAHSRTTTTDVSLEKSGIDITFLDPETGKPLIDPETEKPLVFERCGDYKHNECDIFTDTYQTLAVKEIVVIDSMKPDNTRCCKTIKLGGNWFQSCINVSGRCPRGYY